MSQYKEVEQQVRDAREAGMSDDQIKSELKKVGYSDVDLYHIMNDSKKAPGQSVMPPVAPPVAPSPVVQTPAEPVVQAQPQQDPTPVAPSPASTPNPVSAPMQTAPTPDPISTPQMPEQQQIPQQPQQPQIPQQQPQMSQQPPIAPVRSPLAPPVETAIQPKRKGGVFGKALVIAVVLLLLLSGSTYAYYKVDPFFLKPAEVVLGNSFKSMAEHFSTLHDSEGTLILSATAEDPTNPGTQLSPATMEMDIKFDAENDEINGFYLAWRVPDVEQLVKVIMALYISSGDEQTEFKKELIQEFTTPQYDLSGTVDIESYFFDDSLYFRVNDLPPIVSAFVPGISAMYEKWYYSDEEVVEDLTGVEKEDLTDSKEDLQYSQDRLIKAFLEESNATISTKRVSGDLHITYAASSADLYSALFDATQDIALRFDEPMSDMTKDEFMESVPKGDFFISIVISKDLFITKTLVEFTDDENAMTSSIDIEMDFTSPITLEKPAGAVPFEEAMSQLMPAPDYYESEYMGGDEFMMYEDAYTDEYTTEGFPGYTY